MCCLSLLVLLKKGSALFEEIAERETKLFKMENIAANTIQNQPITKTDELEGLDDDWDDEFFNEEGQADLSEKEISDPLGEGDQALIENQLSIFVEMRHASLSDYLR